MSRMILGNQGNQHDDVPQGADNLIIGGVVYRNTAAKFWSSLFDELLTDFSDYSDVGLRFMTALCLDPALLDPQQFLERDMERLSSSSLEEVIRVSSCRERPLRTSRCGGCGVSICGWISDQP